MSNVDQYAEFFRRCTMVSRTDIFGVNDPIPTHLRDDAHTMFAGYVGPRYRTGGTVLMAVNPGGGGDAYVRRTAQDEIFFPLLAALKQSSTEEAPAAFERINREFASILPNWNLWRIFKPVLDAAGVELEDVAFLNAVPFRTLGDREPAAAARDAAWRLIAGPTLETLCPGLVIALGKKVHRIVQRRYTGSATVICVPRTIGDSYISAEAGGALELIRGLHK